MRCAIDLAVRNEWANVERVRGAAVRGPAHDRSAAFAVETQG